MMNLCYLILANRINIFFSFLAFKYYASNHKLELFVEVLICTDFSVYEMHRSIVSQNKWNIDSDENIRENTVNHIKAYYTQIIDEVN